ncbi:MAG: hypothetical protein P4M11_08835 [Candidatus Pacebacteria bacterium]|nr:hypothetical protein [Candidatus Paceibacterota bacterium]
MIVVSNTHLTSAWKGFKAILYGVRTEMAKYNINEVLSDLNSRGSDNSDESSV